MEWWVQSGEKRNMVMLWYPISKLIHKIICNWLDTLKTAAAPNMQWSADTDIVHPWLKKMKLDVVCLLWKVHQQICWHSTTCGYFLVSCYYARQLKSCNMISLLHALDMGLAYRRATWLFIGVGFVPLGLSIRGQLIYVTHEVNGFCCSFQW